MRLPSEDELQKRRIIGVNADTVTDANSTDFPGHYPGEDNSWSIDKFRKKLHVTFHQLRPLDTSFSLIGVDASVANAFRRILLAEIPTLAIEQVFIFNNTSLVQDEVLAHRLGLVPLQGNKDGLKWLRWFKRATEDDPQSDMPSDYNTIILNLDVECTWQDGGMERYKKGETDPKKLYHNSSVYAHQITFRPTGQQPSHFSEPRGHIRPVNPDILLAKLRPGQCIKLSTHCIKGIGRDHAKFSPVATATYRLLPHIQILKPIIGADARKFARCFPKGVIKLELYTYDENTNDSNNKNNNNNINNSNNTDNIDPETATTAGPDKDKDRDKDKDNNVRAVVHDPMRDTVSRECLRHDEFKDKVKLGRVRDHFIFRIESTGQWDGDELFLESVKVLKLKCAILKKGLGELMRV